jgi:hypothetical protein
MLHYLDDLDSKMEAMRAHFQREPGSDWTAYNPSLERPLLNSRKLIDRMKAGGAPEAAENNDKEVAASDDSAEDL